MNEQLNEALQRMFNKHRIVFWYDSKQELRSDFDSVVLDDVQKLEIDNNEFQLKYRILREEPQQKFLLYKHGPQPGDLQNWLLDVQLAEGEFRADQTALWLTELGLSLEFADIVTSHSEFFKATKRRESLQKLLKGEDTQSAVRLKMVAVCTSSEPRMDVILESLLAELGAGKDDSEKLIQRCELTDFLWGRVQSFYGYTSNEPGVRDFSIELFKSCYAMGTDGEVRLNSEALVFLKRWKDSRRHHEVFEALSEQCEGFLAIENDLADRNYQELVDLDYFELIDRKLLSDLVRNVRDRTISPGDCTSLIRNRRQTHWYDNYRHEYEGIEFASRLIRAIEICQISIETFIEGVQRYTETWQQVDQFYRQFVYHYRSADHQTLLKSLAEEVDRLYSNQFLLPLANQWQEVVDRSEDWNPDKLTQQGRFFRKHVRKYLDQKKKVCVIISDGLRYEIGHEFAKTIRQEDRYTAELTSMVTGLPSYTQLGMASLLPNETLEIQHKSNASVLVDGNSATGTDARQKILDELAPQVSAKAVIVKELLAMNRDECREMTRAHDVIYVYQNIVDKVGDDLLTEQKVCEAAVDAQEELLKVVKKLAAANASNMIITSDHGFLYQDGIEESDFSLAEMKSLPNDYFSRRFVLGDNLPETSGLKHFTAEQLGLQGSTEVLIPKSLNRLRKQGSGARYVHGGATLQEIVVPVVHINKGRSTDVSHVNISVIRGSSNTISTGQLAVLLYQQEPVSEKLQKRTIRIGIYASDGKLLSDRQELEFDFTSENPREREQKILLVLSREADSRNNQQVELKLEERIPGTTQYQEYKTEIYTLKRSFTSDFDFE